MPRLSLFAALAALALAPAPAHSQSDRQAAPSVPTVPALSEADRALAVVDGHAISEARFLDSYARRLAVSGAPDTREARQSHLRRLIDAALLADEARRLGLDETPLARRTRDRLTRHAAGGEFYAEALLQTLPEPTDAEIEAAWAMGHEQVLLRQLYFATEREALAAAAELQSGRRFIDLAQDIYALSTPTPDAGLLGVVGYDDLDDAVAAVAFSLPVGAASAPVRSAHGWHILQVDERFREPLLSESAYSRGRPEAERQVRLQRARVEGRAFAEAMMEREDVEFYEEAVRTLAQAMRAFQDPDRRGGLTPDETDQLTAALDPAAALATYGPAADRREFLVDDYLLWLPVLPPSEAIGRTGASIGRALRNEVLAREGLAAGLDQTAGVQEHIRHQENLLLAAEMRALVHDFPRAVGDAVPVSLTDHPLTPWAPLLQAPTSDELRDGFVHLGYAAAPTAVRADYAFTPAATRAEADDLLASGRWTEAAGFERHTDADLLAEDATAGHARRVAVGAAAVVGTPGGWLVLQVDRREEVLTQFDDVKEQVYARLDRSLPEARLLQALQGQARVSVAAASSALVPYHANRLSR